MDAPAYYSIPSVTRYFDHIQHLRPVTDARALLKTSPYVLKEFDLTNMPPLERKVEVKEKKPKKAVTEGEATASPKEKEAKKGKGEEKKSEEVAPAAVAGGEPKKDAKKKEKKEKPAAAAATPTEPMPSMIDLRVGKVLEGKSQ